MTNYYLLKNEIITQSANFKFDDNCHQTEEEIVRNNEGTLMLKSSYDIQVETDEYKTKIIKQENDKKRAEFKAQIEEFEKSQFRCAKAIFSGNPDPLDIQKYNEYEIQIQNLRTQISGL